MTPDISRRDREGGGDVDRPRPPSTSDSSRPVENLRDPYLPRPQQFLLIRVIRGLRTTVNYSGFPNKWLGDSSFDR